ncbi:MAG TPA: LCP family protein [Candidatus Angelobacter sp.]|nr:LCP family protein [Candidatus Angelobacter sp.]
MVNDATVPSAAARSPRPWLAAVLSFAFPGLGQAYSGRPRDALLFAFPVVVLVLAGIALATGIAGDRNSLLSPEFLTAVMAVNGLLLAWRLAAIIHAGLVPAARIAGRHRRIAVTTVTALLVTSVAMHAWVGFVVAELEGALTQVFAPDPDDDAAAPAPTEPPDPGAAPTPAPIPNRWTEADRINILLLGTDATPGRDSARPDVVLVVSIDPVDESAVLISIPRDTGWLPLPDRRLYPDGLYPNRVNQIAVDAAAAPGRWCPDMPDRSPDRCGRQALERSVGLYLGLEIHHYAVVDMAGFADMIDAVGGLRLCLPGRLVDPEFDGSLENRGAGEPLILPAGCQHYDGLDALAYARSRKGWIEMPDGERVIQTDFDRNERQQQVLLALRRELAQADTLFELPALIGAIGRTVSTDVPREQAGDLAGLLPLITGPNIERVVLGHPDYVDLPVDPEVNYLLIPKRPAIRDAMVELFGRDELSGWYVGSLASGPPALPDEDPVP